MSNTSTGKSGRAADRRDGDRRVVHAQFAGDDRRESERRSGDDRRQAPRVRL